MSEYSFILNVNQHYLRSKLKKTPENMLYCLFFMYVSYGEEKNQTKYSANAALKYYSSGKHISVCAHAIEYRCHIILPSIPILNMTIYRYC